MVYSQTKTTRMRRKRQNKNQRNLGKEAVVALNSHGEILFGRQKTMSADDSFSLQLQSSHLVIYSHSVTVKSDINVDAM